MLVSRKPSLMRSDVIEKNDSYILEVDLPGCEKEDIKTYLEDGYLVITAELNKKPEEKEGRLIRSERYSGKYSRSFYIGNKLHQDDITGSFKNGVLKLNIPKVSKHVPEKGTIEIN